LISFSGRNRLALPSVPNHALFFAEAAAVAGTVTAVLRVPSKSL
jgi:hypothetical protein